MRRPILAALALTLILSACGEQPLGRRIVECDGPSDSPLSSTILMAQSVPGTPFIPCVEALRPGWSAQHVQARSGQAFFTIDSDRMDRVGMDFLRVTLLPSCDIGNALPVPSDEPDTTLSVEVLEEKTDFVIVVAPVAARHEKYAAAVATLLTGETVNHRSIVAGVDNSVRPLSEKVAAAHLTGRPVVIVDDVDAETATVSLRRVGEEERSGLTYTEALEMIEDDIDDPVYRARWFYEFDGGCIRYDIDAKGLGAQSVRFDIARAIGMYPMAEIYDLAREAGYGGFE